MDADEEEIYLQYKYFRPEFYFDTGFKGCRKFIMKIILVKLG